MGRLAVAFRSGSLREHRSRWQRFRSTSRSRSSCHADSTDRRACIDGAGGAALENATLLVANGRIQEVGTAVKVPAGATRVDLRGKTIIPGLINSHGHVDAARSSSEPVRDQLLAQLRSTRIRRDHGLQPGVRRQRRRRGSEDQG